METILTAESVTFGYSNSSLILDNFNLTVNQGDMLGIIGSNGAGKSTALKLLSGYLVPDKGVVKLNNGDIRNISNKERAKTIAVVVQNIFIPLPFTVRQIVEMGRALRISRFLPFCKDDRLAIDKAMQEMDVIEFADKSFNELSGGEKQRVKIASALVQEPDVLLLDEPTSQLDIGHSVRLMQYLKKLNKERNISIVLVSHDIQLVAGFMKQIMLLKRGKIVSSGNVEETLKKELIEETYDCKVKVVEIDNQLQIIPII